MTTKRTYECNLCRSPVTQADGRGFSFGHHRLDWNAVNQTENHLCGNCIMSLIVSLADSGIREDFGSPPQR